MFGSKKLVKKSEVATGIDIGNFSVKAVQVSRKNEEITLEGFGYSKIDTRRPDGVIEAVKFACGEAKLSYKKVNSAIASEGAIVRYLMLPEMTSEDLSKAMEFEIERYVPFDKKDVISDYLVLKERSDTKNIKVLLVAAKKEFVDSRAKMLKEAGLEPEVITIDSLVLKNTFQANYLDKTGKTIGLINIGAKASNINIIRDAASYFMRDVQLGGESITHLLKEKLEISVEEAEKLKCSLTLEDKEKFKIIEPVLGNLLNEVYLSFDYYESEFGMVVDEVFISGGTAQLLLLPGFLKANLNREIAVLDPLQNIRIGAAVSAERVKSFSASLVVPIGLAL